MTAQLKPIVLVVLDGWGHRDEQQHNPIAEARTPFFDELWNSCPHALLDASGVQVGLPEGQMGNSEIGHMVIGSGMKIPTDLVRIREAIDAGELNTNPAIQTLFTQVKKFGSTLHLVGLIGPGGVHAHGDHLIAMLHAAKNAGIARIAIHGFTDGRDTPPQSGAAYLEELEGVIDTLGVGCIASVTGRFFAMDRDQHWDRIAKAEAALFEHTGQHCTDTPSITVRQMYASGQLDEHLEPLVFSCPENTDRIRENDAVFFFNFRADRAVQLSRRILERTRPMNVRFATMTIYADDLECDVAFPSFTPPTTLAAELSRAGFTQAHIAETEKFAHATYFLNGGRFKPHAGEEHLLVESRKDVRTHDEAPEMRATEITDRAIDAINRDVDFLFLNYANADMVGHTANHAAVLRAIETLDVELSRLVTAVRAHGGCVFITADHGNAEQSRDGVADLAHTAHTVNLVPAILTDTSRQMRQRGTLADIAPTILELFDLPIPSSMTGTTLRV